MWDFKCMTNYKYIQNLVFLSRSQWEGSTEIAHIFINNRLKLVPQEYNKIFNFMYSSLQKTHRNMHRTRVKENINFSLVWVVFKKTHSTLHNLLDKRTLQHVYSNNLIKPYSQWNQAILIYYYTHYTHTTRIIVQHTWFHVREYSGITGVHFFHYLKCNFRCYLNNSVGWRSFNVNNIEHVQLLLLEVLKLWLESYYILYWPNSISMNFSSKLPLISKSAQAFTIPYQLTWQV